MMTQAGAAAGKRTRQNCPARTFNGVTQECNDARSDHVTQECNDARSDQIAVPLDRHSTSTIAADYRTTMLNFSWHQATQCYLQASDSDTTAGDDTPIPSQHGVIVSRSALCQHHLSFINRNVCPTKTATQQHSSTAAA